jgi:hypothetical protein
MSLWSILLLQCYFFGVLFTFLFLFILLSLLIHKGHTFMSPLYLFASWKSWLLRDKETWTASSKYDIYTSQHAIYNTLILIIYSVTEVFYYGIHLFLSVITETKIYSWRTAVSSEYVCYFSLLRKPTAGPIWMNVNIVDKHWILSSHFEFSLIWFTWKLVSLTSLMHNDYYAIRITWSNINTDMLLPQSIFMSFIWSSEQTTGFVMEN